MQDERQVSKEHAELFAKKNNMHYVETSAINAVNVDEVILIL
jgi:hypothetical protein